MVICINFIKIKRAHNKMLSYITLPIRILISALLLSSPNSNGIEIQSTDSNLSITVDFQNETETEIYFEAVLKDSETARELGRVVYSYNKNTKTGYIARLHVNRDERKHSYGSKLLKFALTKLTNLQCIGIYWQAYPFDLLADQTSENMLPKLIAFYKRHGAQVLSQNSSSAQMAYYPQITAQIA